MRPEFEPGHADRPARTVRRRCLGLAIAGLGALAVPAARGGDGPEAPRAPKGRIFATANLGARLEGVDEAGSVVAIDPATGERTTVLDGCGTRPRVSPDGRTIAFTRSGAVWTRSVAGGDEPKRLLDLEGTPAGSPPVWSPVGTKIIVSLGRIEKDNGPWVHKTVRVNADGSGLVELKVPREDTVQDWSSDGEWLLTASSRNARIGWQLYVMHPDGTGVRQITEGGNPFYARFSPDGRRVLYADGTTEERRGIWVVERDGNGRRKVCSTGKAQVSACWSPDGARLAVAFRHFNVPGVQGEKDLLEVMDLDGKQEGLFDLPDGSGTDMPDWR
jgi:Tol biopolymer transport system component